MDQIKLYNELQKLKETAKLFKFDKTNNAFTLSGLRDLRGNETYLYHRIWERIKSVRKDLRHTKTDHISKSHFQYRQTLRRKLRKSIKGCGPRITFHGTIPCFEECPITYNDTYKELMQLGCIYCEGKAILQAQKIPCDHDHLELVAFNVNFVAKRWNYPNAVKQKIQSNGVLIIHEDSKIKVIRKTKEEALQALKKKLTHKVSKKLGV